MQSLEKQTYISINTCQEYFNPLNLYCLPPKNEFDLL